MFDKHIENPSDYISQNEILDTLLENQSVTDVFYPNIVKDIKSSTMLLRFLEGLSIIIFALAILYSIIEWFLYGLSIKQFSVSVFFAIMAAVVYFILRNFRTEHTVETLLEKSQNPHIAKNVLDYFSQLRASNYDIAKSKAEGPVSIGKVHRADGGILCLLGKKTDRHAIRALSMGWGELYFPRVDIILPTNLSVQSTSPNLNPKQQSNIDINQTKINQYTTVNVKMGDINFSSKSSNQNYEDITPFTFYHLGKELKIKGYDISTIDGLKKLAESRHSECQEFYDLAERLLLNEPLSVKKAQIVERGFAIIESIAKNENPSKNDKSDDDTYVTERNGKAWKIGETMFAEFSRGYNRAFSLLLKENSKAREN